MQNKIDLSGMKDIKLPIEPDWFPLASGWWVIFVGFVILCALISFMGIRSYFSAKSYTLRTLKAMKNASLSDIEFAKEASKLLKRVAILKFGSDRVASLSDQKWGLFLLDQGKNLTEAQANFIAFASYLPEDTQEKITMADLYPAVHATLIQLFKGNQK